jgi:uncharacterized protein YjiS (DUF1127 family)
LSQINVPPEAVDETGVATSVRSIAMPSTINQLSATPRQLDAAPKAIFPRRLWRRLSAAVSAWRERDRCRRELDALAVRCELGRVLADAGLAEWQVPAILHSAPHRTELLESMMRRVGIDPAAKPISGFRDLEWTCANCLAEQRCRDWLAQRRADDYHQFCRNAEELDAIKLKQ